MGRSANKNSCILKGNVMGSKGIFFYSFKENDVDPVNGCKNKLRLSFFVRCFFSSIYFRFIRSFVHFFV